MSQLTGINRETKKGQGGIKSVNLTEFENVTNQSIVDGVAKFNTEAGVWKNYAVDYESGSNFIDKSVGSRKEGTVYNDQTLALIFVRYTLAKRNELEALSESTICANVEMNNGETFMLGFENGLDLSEGIGSSGESLEVGSKLTPTFIGKEFKPAPSVSSADLASIKAGEAVIAA
ncbi:hypothetical protein EV201_1261 [Ancylomarina subtilis]|uniref:Uncharacterized protein n=1 Tax=Ancylomarina subtilis TaxID=1639035 RepID=A0A4Q7VK70_9BACT|nr:hypothetical protein [Ancylomarina subtilis]RZT96620.1 hypothetical protein EV201_1261 [Ancylomarina subtilis]